MEVKHIEMPKKEAAEKFEAYRKRLLKMRHSRANEEVRAEYEAAMKGYEQLAKGTPLIDLDDVMRTAPCDEKGRPRLAVARADRKQVEMRWPTYRTEVTFNSEVGVWTPRESLVITVNMAREANPNRDLVGYSIVPMVPPNVRPEVGQLKDWCILWEVEQWADRQISSAPDIDPYLLKHLGGSLYAVIAEWDLTDLERSIMKGRMEKN